MHMNPSNQFEELPLSIAGFPITLKFEPINDYPQEKKTFKKSLLKYLGHFNSDKHSGKHTTINIVDREHYQIVFSKTTSYAELARYRNAHTIEVPYQVSITQFFMTLSNLLTALLYQNHGIILHASACLINGKAHVFMGTHGAGKSTIVRLLRKKFTPLADDLIFIRKLGSNYAMYQTPNIEKTPWIYKKNSPYSIGGIYLLKQTKITYKHRLDSPKAAKYILSNMLFKSKEKKPFVSTVFDFISKNPILYELGFNLDAQSIFPILESKSE